MSFQFNRLRENLEIFLLTTMDVMTDFELVTVAISGLNNVQIVSGGMDASAVTLSGSLDGERVFVKVVPKVSPGVRFASSVGHPQVLAPQSITAMPDGRWALVYPWIEGKNGFESVLQSHHWMEVGRILREVHRSRSEYLLPETFVIEGLTEFASSRLTSPYQGLFEIHSADLDRGFELVERLSHECRDASWEFVPCHADLHVGNIVVADDRVFLVDWDTARLAPVECDFLFFESPGILLQHTVIEEIGFRDGYGEMEPRKPLMSYYRFARAFEDIVSFAREGNVKWLERQFGPGSMLDLALSRA
ncbi:MAG: aminoglycoside phosphotransferase family protein [Armatimonadota bacterium]